MINTINSAIFSLFFSFSIVLPYPNQLVFGSPAQITIEELILGIEDGSLQSNSEKTLNLVFTPGKNNKVPQALKQLILLLHSKGFRVQTQLKSESEFDQLINSQNTTGQVIDFSQPPPQRTRSSFLQKLKAALGIAFHRQKIALDPLKSFADFSEQEKKLFLTTTLMHTSLTLAVSGFMGEVNFASAAMLTLYFYQTFANFSEIMLFKGQGKSVLRNGDQLSVTVNPYFVYLTNLFEEFVLNTSLNATLPVPQMHSTGELLETSLIFSLIKTNVDRHAAQLEADIVEAREQGLQDYEKKLTQKQSCVLNFFFNGVVPFLKGLVTFSHGTRFEPACSMLNPVMAFTGGCVLVYQELRRILRMNRLPGRFKGQSCARAFVSL